MMYQKRTEALLRERLDPDFLLPYVWLKRPDMAEQLPHARYEVFHDFQSVGEIMLGRARPQVGRGIMQLESLHIKVSDQRDSLKYALLITVLATSISEGRVLISDPNGSRYDEAGMWHWFADHGLATITEMFRTRPELHRGREVFEGQAYASPDHIDRLGAMSSV